MLSINQTVDSRVSSAFTRVPPVFAKFGTEDHRSTINSAPEFTLFTLDLCALAPVSCGIRPLAHTRVIIPDKIQFMIPGRRRLSAIAIAYLWSISVWLAFAPMLAGQDKLRVLERGLNAPYWDLLLAEGAWLLTAAL